MTRTSSAVKWRGCPRGGTALGLRNAANSSVHARAAASTGRRVLIQEDEPALLPIAPQQALADPRVALAKHYGEVLR